MPADLWSKFSLVGRVIDGVGDEVIKEHDLSRPSRAEPIRTKLMGLFSFFSPRKNRCKRLSPARGLWPFDIASPRQLHV